MSDGRVHASSLGLGGSGLGATSLTARITFPAAPALRSSASSEALKRADTPQVRIRNSARFGPWAFTHQQQPVRTIRPLISGQFQAGCGRLIRYLPEHTKN
jgi:hypothetical protein